MDGDNDNGYHSNDNDVEMADGDAPDYGESHAFDDLVYDDEILLEEPDYEVARTERLKRNVNVMKNFNPHIANAMLEEEAQEFVSYKDGAAVVIQKHVRGFLAQRKYLQLLLEQFEENERLRREKTMEQVEEAGLLLENHKLEVEFEDYNVVRRNRVQRLICHVITIQRAWRKFCARRKDQQQRNKFYGDISENMTCGGEHNDDELEDAASSFVEEVIANALASLSPVIKR